MCRRSWTFAWISYNLLDYLTNDLTNDKNDEVSSRASERLKIVNEQIRKKELSIKEGTFKTKVKP